MKSKRNKGELTIKEENKYKDQNGNKIFGNINESPLFFDVATDNPTRVRQQFYKLGYYESMSHRTPGGGTALHLCKDPKISKVLMELGFDPDKPDKVGKTPLHVAFSEKQAQALTDALNGRVNIPDHYGNLPIHNENYYFAYIRNLHDPNYENDNGNTPLNVFFRSVYNIGFDGKGEAGREVKLEEMLSHGCNPNIADADGVYPIMQARYLSDLDLLFQYGADPNVMDIYGRSAIDYYTTPEFKNKLFEHGLTERATKRATV